MYYLDVLIYVDLFRTILESPKMLDGYDANRKNSKVVKIDESLFFFFPKKI